MPTLNIVDQMTALEVARRSSDPDAFTIIETMSMTNALLRELPAVEANDGAIHTHLLRRSYPGGEHRMYNQGVGRRSSQTEPVQDRIAILEAFSKVDEALARHSGNPQALYQSEASAFLYGMGENQADDLIYGNAAVNGAELNGLATRLSSISDHCIDFGGTGDPLTSVYLIASGRQACHLIYPRGSSSVGVRREDLGVETVLDANGNEYRAHVDHFIAEYGIAIEHPDAVIRIANIPANLNTSGRQQLIELILRHQKRLSRGVVNTILLANQDLLYHIERAGREAQMVLYPDTVED